MQNTSAPNLEPVIPECPPQLNEIARAEWDRVCRILHAAGVITVADRAILAAYCVEWARYIEAAGMLTLEGPIVKAPKTEVPMHNLHLSVANRALTNVIRLAAELGLTPSSRSRIHAESPADTQDAAAREFFGAIDGPD